MQLAVPCGSQTSKDAQQHNHLVGLQNGDKIRVHADAARVVLAIHEGAHPMATHRAHAQTAISIAADITRWPRHGAGDGASE